MSQLIWRRAVAGALAGAAVFGGLASALAPAALAQPADSSAAPTQPAMTADQALALIAREYDLGAGGGQLSKLIDQVLALRANGVRPSPANRAAIVAALDKRPNQAPLIEALEATLSYQRQQISRAGISPAGGAPAVAAPGSPHAPMGPAWGPGNPMDRSDDAPIFPMPGR